MLTHTRGWPAPKRTTRYTNISHQPQHDSQHNQTVPPSHLHFTFSLCAITAFYLILGLYFKQRMSNFSVSPTGLKPVTSQTKFTNLMKASNQSMSKQGTDVKQTKFTDLITSSNQSRCENEKQRETIATLTAQVSELTKTHKESSDAHIKREKEVIFCNPLTHLTCLYSWMLGCFPNVFIICVLLYCTVMCL